MNVLNEQVSSSMDPALVAELTETFSSFAGIAVIVFLIFVLWGAFQGWRRSIFRQGVHLVITVIVAIIAFNSTASVCGDLLSSFDGMTMDEFIIVLEQEFTAQGIELGDTVKSMLGSFDMASLGYVIAIFFNTLMAPLVFAVLFAMIAVAAKVVTGIVCFFVPKGKSMLFRGLGIAGGVIEGALIAGIVLLPLVGWVNIAGTAVDVVRENSAEDDPTASAIVEFYDDAVVPLENHVIFQMVGSLGGNDALTTLATVDDNGTEKDLRGEFVTFTKLGMDVIKLSDADFKNLTEDDKATVKDVIADMGDSIIITNLICGATKGLAGAVDEGTLPITIDPPYDKVLTELVSFLGGVTPETIKEDLTTFADLYFLLSDEGVLATFNETADGEGASASEDALNEALTKTDENGKTVINRAIDILDENPRTSKLISVLGEISVSILYKELGLEGDAEVVYDTVTNGVKNVLSIDTENKTKDEVAADVNSELRNTLDSVGITVGTDGHISDEVLGEMSDIVAEELMNGNISLGEDGEVSDADVLNVLLSYYQSLQNNETPEE